MYSTWRMNLQKKDIKSKNEIQRCITVLKPRRVDESSNCRSDLTAKLLQHFQTTKINALHNDDSRNPLFVEKW